MLGFESPGTGHPCQRAHLQPPQQRPRWGCRHPSCHDAIHQHAAPTCWLRRAPGLLRWPHGRGVPQGRPGCEPPAQPPSHPGPGMLWAWAVAGAGGPEQPLHRAPAPSPTEASRRRRDSCPTGQGPGPSAPALPQLPEMEALLMTLLNDSVHFLPLKVLKIRAHVIHYYYYLIKDYLTHFHVSSNYKLKLFPL